MRKPRARASEGRPSSRTRRKSKARGYCRAEPGAAGTRETSRGAGGAYRLAFRLIETGEQNPRMPKRHFRKAAVPPRRGKTIARPERWFILLWRCPRKRRGRDGYSREVPYPRAVRGEKRLRSDGRPEGRDAAVGDGASGRALEVQRRHADLRGGRRPLGLKSQDQHLGVCGRSGILVRDPDEDRALGIDAVAEVSGMLRPEIAAGPHRHRLEDGGIEAHLHRRGADVLARGHAERYVEARAGPRACGPLPPELCRSPRGQAGQRRRETRDGRSAGRRGLAQHRRALRRPFGLPQRAELHRLAHAGRNVEEAHLARGYRLDLVLALQGVTL